LSADKFISGTETSAGDNSYWKTIEVFRAVWTTTGTSSSVLDSSKSWRVIDYQTYYSYRIVSLDVRTYSGTQYLYGAA